MKMKKRISNNLVLTILAASLTLSATALAGKGKGNGTVKPFDLSVTALQDISGKTDVYFNVGVIENGYSPPGNARHIQLKSFDLNDELRWTENLKDIELSEGSAEVSYLDMIRYQPVQTQVQVQTAESKNTEVLRADASVLFRPDLKVSAPGDTLEVVVGEVLNVVINVEELNGDLGAETSVNIINGLIPLDYIDNVQVAASSGSSLIFALTFDEPGEYNLTAITGDVTPGDYDLSNNSSDFTVVVTEPVAAFQTVPYYISYNRSWSDYHNEYYSSYYYHYIYQSSYHWESLNNSIYWNDDLFSWPVESISVSVTADGGVPVIEAGAVDIYPGYSSNWGCYTYEQAYVPLSEGVNVHISSNSNSCTGDVYSQSMQLYTWSNSSTYYSYNFYHYNSNPTEYSYEYYSGSTEIGAISDISTYITVENNGVTVGGRSNLTVSGYSYSYYDYYESDEEEEGEISYYYLYESSYGYYYGWGSGITEE